VSEDRVLRDLSRLPYMAMRRLASRVGVALKVDDKNHDKIAKAMAEAVEHEPVITGLDEFEAHVFTNFFTRKRSLSIVPDGDGWRIDMHGAPTVHCTDIRNGLNDFLDALTAYKGLTS